MGPRTAVVKVDASWTKKELISECKRRGISGYSRLDKASIICCLNKGQGELKWRVDKVHHDGKIWLALLFARYSSYACVLMCVGGDSRTLELVQLVE